MMEGERAAIKGLYMKVKNDKDEVSKEIFKGGKKVKQEIDKIMGDIKGSYGGVREG